jgi:hypothetical protein
MHRTRQKKRKNYPSVFDYQRDLVRFRELKRMLNILGRLNINLHNRPHGQMLVQPKYGDCLRSMKTCLWACTIGRVRQRQGSAGSAS